MRTTHAVLVSLLLTLNIFHTSLWCFHCCLWISKCQKCTQVSSKDMWKVEIWMPTLFQHFNRHPWKGFYQLAHDNSNISKPGGLQLYKRRDSNTGAFQWILWNFKEQLFDRTPLQAASVTFELQKRFCLILFNLSRTWLVQLDISNSFI